MPARPDGVATIFVVSDGTGETAAAAVRAVMLQFQDSWNTRVVGSVRHESQVRRVIGEASRTAMREVLDEIQSGAFAKKWIEEAHCGGPNFERRRQEEGAHILETTGDALRGRMSWL